MASDVVLSALLVCLIPVLVSAGVVKRQAEDLEDTMSPCRTYVMNGLLHLDCSNRGLKDLPDELDYTAQVLLLSNNNFHATFPTQLQNFSRVETLDLSGNHLSHPIPSYLQNWVNLQTLNLSNNLYDTWTTNGQKYLKNLDLSKNKINAVDDRAFTTMPNLRFLDLSENRINDLPPEVFSEAHNLDSLILSRNYFSDVPSFQSPSLRSLHLSSCQIANINVDSLVRMGSLLELDLSINQIEAIPENLASHTLQELNLSYNSINALTDNSFSSLPHLAVLDLRGNEFRDVWSTSHFASNPFLREVYVKGNRWSCEGFSVNLLLTYEFLTKEPTKIVDRESLICYSPSNVTQLSWQQAYIRTWHPVDSSSPPFTTIALMVGVIIGIMVTSCVCRGLVSITRPNQTRQTPDTSTVNLNGSATQPRVESVILRVPLDPPPSYEDALLMPRLNSSFHSLPDFVDEEEPRNYRRSRSIGDLTETRPRIGDRRSMRRPVEIHTRISIE